MRLLRAGSHTCAHLGVLFALLFAAGAGCDRRESEAERLQRRMNAEQSQSQHRLDVALSALEAGLTKQEDVLRRARGDKLLLEERFDLVEAWDKAMDQMTKQLD